MSKRILVVEDDDAAWDVMAMCFQREPYVIEREKNGTKALELIQKGDYAAVLLDLMLPGLSGEEILKVLDRDPRFKGFPILINSSVGETQWMKNQLNAFKNLQIELTPRPFDPLDLIEALRKCLGISVTDSVRKRQVAEKKVLIVDDDSAVRAMYIPYFTVKGYSIVAASNGKEAIEILKKEQVDLMILDLNMPEMTGEEVMEKMMGNSTWKKIPILIDTAVDPASGRLDKIKKVFTGKLRLEFYQRPTSLQELNDAIDRILIA